MKTIKRYNTLAAMALAMFALVMAGCSSNFWQNRFLPSPAVVARPASSQVEDAGTDAHYIRVDEYFVMEQPLANQSFVFASLAKMQARPSPEHELQGRFLRILDNVLIWTSHYTKTRVARESDLVLNREVFFLQLTDDNGNYRAPFSSNETRNGWWIKARITDLSNKNHGFVQVSGGYRVYINALRVEMN
ncbi:MAG: hypothetical protein GX135_06330 [Candidatus Cloacimonetes bacterium]|nr:hypothetical protein [Candidatus Cloacimonadota bacterium]